MSSCGAGYLILRASTFRLLQEDRLRSWLSNEGVTSTWFLIIEFSKHVDNEGYEHGYHDLDDHHGPV